MPITTKIRRNGNDVMNVAGVIPNMAYTAIKNSIIYPIKKRLIKAPIPKALRLKYSTGI